jgi:hypothetical protein
MIINCIVYFKLDIYFLDLLSYIILNKLSEVEIIFIR